MKKKAKAARLELIQAYLSYSIEPVIRNSGSGFFVWESRCFGEGIVCENTGSSCTVDKIEPGKSVAGCRYELIKQ